LRSEINLSGARVLDLYAGSGAVGLEALSRGADVAVFVESNKRAAAILQRNVDLVGLPGGIVVCRTTESYLAVGVADEPFDLIFADPPYAATTDTVNTLLCGLADERWFASGGVVVLERPWRESEPQWPSEIVALKQKRYGEGCLWYGRRA
jgi:16S rRNA (guanine966-N2)-methyltransferase